MIVLYNLKKIIIVEGKVVVDLTLEIDIVDRKIVTVINVIKKEKRINIKKKKRKKKKIMIWIKFEINIQKESKY